MTTETWAAVVDTTETWVGAMSYVFESDYVDEFYVSPNNSRNFTIWTEVSEEVEAWA